MSSLQKQYKKLAGFSIALKIEEVNTSFLAAKAVKSSGSVQTCI